MSSPVDERYHIKEPDINKEFQTYLHREYIVFCCIGMAAWLLYTLLLFRAQWKAKKRRRKEDMFVVLEAESGEAHYMVSFFTQGNYTLPPTGVVELHIIGSLYPGKIHELVAHSAKETFLLFPPLCRDKFLVTEDVCLGRILAIILRTTVIGAHPTWNCESVIVRDILTNEAWYFHVHREVDYPPRTFLPATHDELCTFKFSFKRRLRREIRNGQYTLYSFWFRSKSSVYTTAERYVTAVAYYAFLFVVSFFFLDFVWPPQYHDINPKVDKSKSKLQDDVTSQLDYWGKHVWRPALVSSILTTLVGFALVSAFRQQSKYENNFDEMDYVIGTALHESDDMKELHMSRQAAKSVTGTLDGISSAEAGETSSRRRSDAHGRRDSQGQNQRGMSMQEDGTFASSVLRRLTRFNPFSKSSVRKLANRRATGDTASRASLSIATAPSRMSLSSQYSESDTSINTHMGPANTKTASTATIRPSSPSNFSGAEPPAEPAEQRELTPLERRIEMRKMFMGRNLHDHIINNDETMGRRKERKTQPFRPGVNSHSDSLPYKAGTRNSMDPAERLLFGIPGKGKHFVYGMNQEKENAHKDSIVDATQNPYDLGYFEAPVRKWYQPIYAWIIVIIIIILCATYIIVAFMVFKRSYLAGGETELFVEAILAAFVTSLLFVTFVSEPAKIVLVAVYFALRDKNIYKRITHKTKKRRLDAEIMLHMNAT